MKSALRHSLAAEERAALWAARLDGSVLSIDDQLELQRWLSEAPAHRTLLSSYCQFSADLEQQLPQLEGIQELTAESCRTSRPAFWQRRSIWISSTMAAAAAIAVFFWQGQPALQKESIATTIAQRQQITLTDGTVAELNAHTSLRVEIDKDHRYVRLADGEVFFSVAKDASRPFVVETRAGSVRVTGTQFNVRAETNQSLEVTVLEGSVQVRPDSVNQTAEAPVALTAGNHLISNPQGVKIEMLEPTSLDNLLAWRHGQIVFSGTPLRDALDRFARYHGRGLVAQPEVAELRVGGRYSLDDLDGFFSSLEEVLPVQVTRQSNGTIAVVPRIAR